MKTQDALEIAEHIWADTVSEGSLLDTLIRLEPTLSMLKNQGKEREALDNLMTIKYEIVARWANLIKEVSKSYEN